MAMTRRTKILRLWCGFLAGDRLSAREQMELARALETDEALRLELLKDERTETMLRELAGKKKSSSTGPPG
jgi:hypothetical protein